VGGGVVGVMRCGVGFGCWELLAFAYPMASTVPSVAGFCSSLPQRAAKSRHGPFLVGMRALGAVSRQSRRSRSAWWCLPTLGRSARRFGGLFNGNMV